MTAAARSKDLCTTEALSHGEEKINGFLADR